ncbi:MAG: flagellar protein FliT [Selenomonadaceae bacterium]|nr:flagellar protein FliT [Selenomonadaceae bacterium]
MPDETVANDEEVLQQASTLWNKYLTLTHELLKFISKNDVDTFFELVNQRDKLIEMMKALPENNFRETDECKAMIEQIKPLDMQIMYKARAWLNKSRRQNNTVRAYDLTGTAGTFGGRGTIFNRKY